MGINILPTEANTCCWRSMTGVLGIIRLNHQYPQDILQYYITITCCQKFNEQASTGSWSMARYSTTFYNKVELIKPHCKVPATEGDLITHARARNNTQSKVEKVHTALMSTMRQRQFSQSTLHWSASVTVEQSNVHEIGSHLFWFDDILNLFTFHSESSHQITVSQSGYSYGTVRERDWSNDGNNQTNKISSINQTNQKTQCIQITKLMPMKQMWKAIEVVNCKNHLSWNGQGRE